MIGVHALNLLVIARFWMLSESDGHFLLMWIHMMPSVFVRKSDHTPWLCQTCPLFRKGALRG